MFNRKYISHMFYIHRSLPLAVATACLFLAYTVVFFAADDAFLQCVAALAAAVMFILTFGFVYEVYRFEKRYGVKS